MWLQSSFINRHTGRDKIRANVDHTYPQMLDQRLCIVPIDVC